MKFAIKAQSYVASLQDIKKASGQQGLVKFAAAQKFPLSEVPSFYLQASILFFLACLTIFFKPGYHDSNGKASPLFIKRKDVDGASSSSTEGSYSYSGESQPWCKHNSPAFGMFPPSPSGLVVRCEPRMHQTHREHNSGVPRTWHQPCSSVARQTEGFVNEDNNNDSNDVLRPCQCDVADKESVVSDTSI